MRQAYDYWQDQPGSYPEGNRRAALFRKERSATRRGPFGNAASEESRNRWVFCPECGNKPPQTAAPIEKQARPPAGPFARSHFSFELPGWTKEPEDASSESDAQRRREPTDRGLPTKGRADPPKRARARQTSTTCLPQATPWRGRHRRPQPVLSKKAPVAARQSGPTRFVTTYDFASRIKTNPIIVRRPSQQKQRQPRPPRPVGSESDRTMGANTRRFARGAEPGSRRAAVRGRPSQTTSERTSRGCRSSNYSRLAQSSDRRAPRRQKPPARPLRSRVAQSRRTASQLAPFAGVRSRGTLARAPLSWVRETHVRAIAAHEGVEWLREGSNECKYTCHARHTFADLQRPPFFGTAEVTSHQRARELGAPAARAQPARNARGSFTTGGMCHAQPPSACACAGAGAGDHGRRAGCAAAARRAGRGGRGRRGSREAGQRCGTRQCAGVTARGAY